MFVAYDVSDDDVRDRLRDKLKFHNARMYTQSCYMIPMGYQMATVEMVKRFGRQACVDLVVVTTDDIDNVKSFKSKYEKQMNEDLKFLKETAKAVRKDLYEKIESGDSFKGFHTRFQKPRKLWDELFMLIDKIGDKNSRIEVEVWRTYLDKLEKIYLKEVENRKWEDA